MMTPAQIAAQREIDEEIVSYIREMQESAPVRPESVAAFLIQIRRRKLMMSQVADRLAYLVSRGLLAVKQEWSAGEGNVLYYTVTADGRVVLDGVKPWAVG